MPGFEMARDVFHHHDGIVDHETGGDGERHERKIVEAVAEQVHHREGAEQRCRHCDRRNESRARISQKNENHEDHQNDGNDQRALHVADGGADGGGAVEHRWSRRCRRESTLSDDGKLRFDRVDGLNDVGAGLAENDQHYGALAIQISAGADVLHGVGDVGDVGQVNGRAVVDSRR